MACKYQDAPHCSVDMRSPVMCRACFNTRSRKRYQKKQKGEPVLAIPPEARETALSLINRRWVNNA